MASPTATARSIWCVVGAALGLESALGTLDRLPYLFAVPAIPSVIHLALTPLFPKSPKELFIAEGDTLAAEKSIRFYHGDYVDVDAVLSELQLEADLCRSQRRVTVCYILRYKHLYMPFLICIAIYCGFAVCVSDPVSFYSAHILTKMGSAVDAKAVAVYCNIPAVFISLASMVAIKVCGRRPVTIASFVFGVLAGACFTVGMSITPFNSMLSQVLGITGITFSMCAMHTNEMMASILPGEICPLGSRSLSTAWATTLGWFATLVSSLTYLEMEAAIGGLTFLPYFVIDFMLLVFIWYSMPETKGRAINEILAKWTKEDEALEPLLAAASSLTINTTYGSIGARSTLSLGVQNSMELSRIVGRSQRQAVSQGDLLMDY